MQNAMVRWDFSVMTMSCSYSMASPYHLANNLKRLVRIIELDIFRFILWVIAYKAKTAFLTHLEALDKNGVPPNENMDTLS